MTIAKTTTAALAGIVLTAASSVTLAATQPEGIYSADQLMDADVYLKNSDKRVGEIDDIILDNDMTVQSFVLETGGHFGFGGQSYVIEPDQISVTAEPGDEATEPEYRITLDADANALKGYPVYNDSWWNNAQSQANDAWGQTKQSADSAWTQIKQGTADLVDQTREAINNATEDTGDAADNAADQTGDAANDATERTQDAGN